jgi:hypothetical protein
VRKSSPFASGDAEGHVGWFFALENATCIDADFSIANEIARAVAHKTANFNNEERSIVRLVDPVGR